jgi:hypothetical protein
MKTTTTTIPFRINQSFSTRGPRTKVKMWLTTVKGCQLLDSTPVVSNGKKAFATNVATGASFHIFLEILCCKESFFLHFFTMINIHYLFNSYY